MKVDFSLKRGSYKKKERGKKMGEKGGERRNKRKVKKREMTGERKNFFFLLHM